MALADLYHPFFFRCRYGVPPHVSAVDSRGRVTYRFSTRTDVRNRINVRYLITLGRQSDGGIIAGENKLENFYPPMIRPSISPDMMDFFRRHRLNLNVNECSFPRQNFI
jgi:hypothetical protein